MTRGVPCGPINSIAEGFALATELGLSPVVQVPTGDPSAESPLDDTGDATRRTVATVANPIRLSRTPATYQSAPPRLGQHNRPGPGERQHAESAERRDPGRTDVGVSS